MIACALSGELLPLPKASEVIFGLHNLQRGSGRMGICLVFLCSDNVASQFTGQGLNAIGGRTTGAQCWPSRAAVHQHDGFAHTHLRHTSSDKVAQWSIFGYPDWSMPRPG